MPVAVPGQASQASNVQQAAYVCNEWGHCWHRHYGGGGYPHRWRRGWHRHWGGYGGWHLSPGAMAAATAGTTGTGVAAGVGTTGITTGNSRDGERGFGPFRFFATINPRW